MSWPDRIFDQLWTIKLFKVYALVLEEISGINVVIIIVVLYVGQLL